MATGGWAEPDDEDPDRPPVRGKKRKFEDEGLP